MELPPLLKAEVKLSTGRAVQLSLRELEALAVEGAGLGILAALFANGDREWDGRWLLVDAAAIRPRAGESVTVTQEALRRASRQQPGLDPLRQHVDASWPGFLAAFREVALEGHEALLDELDRCHREGRLAGRLPRHEVLELEHRAALSELLARHGEAGAGRLVQDLLAYVLAFAGYRTVTNNPVGVPDFTLSDAASTSPDIVLALARAEVERLVELCQAGGEPWLAHRLAERLRRP